MLLREEREGRTLAGTSLAQRKTEAELRKKTSSDFQPSFLRCHFFFERRKNDVDDDG